MKLRRMRPREPILFSALILLFLIPIWWFGYFPTQDGPTHVYNAKILSDYFWEDGSPFRDFLYLNPRFDPTWFVHSILSTLMFVFSPLVAEKVLLSVYVVALPVGMRYAITSVNPDAGFLAVLVFPFVLNSVLHFGFYSFCLSLAAMLFFLGYFYRRNGRWTIGGLLGLSVLSLLLYMLHVVTLGMAYLCVAILALVALALAKNKTWATLVNHGMKPLLAFVPTLALVVFFLHDRETLYVFEDDLLVRLRYALLPMSLFSFRTVEILAAVGFALPLLLIAFKSLFPKLADGMSVPDAFIIAAILLSVISFFVAAPFVLTEGSLPGGGFIRDRMDPVPWFLLIIWLASIDLGLRTRRFIQVLAVAGSVFFLVWHVTTYSLLQPQMEEYLSAGSHVERGSSVLPINVSNGGLDEHGDPLSNKADPFLNLASHLGTERAVVILQNYEAGLGYFPLRFQPELNPEVHLGRMIPTDGMPPDIDLPRYSEQTGFRPDYVMIWLGQRQDTHHPNVTSLYAQIEDDYTLTYTSENGLLELFEYAPQP